MKPQNPYIQWDAKYLKNHYICQGCASTGWDNCFLMFSKWFSEIDFDDLIDRWSDYYSDALDKANTKSEVIAVKSFSEFVREEVQK